jgi:hypothetical protein
MLAVSSLPHLLNTLVGTTTATLGYARFEAINALEMPSLKASYKTAR